MQFYLKFEGENDQHAAKRTDPRHMRGYLPEEIDQQNRYDHQRCTEDHAPHQCRHIGIDQQPRFE